MQKWVIFLFLHTNDLCFKIKAICVLDTARLLPHCAGFIFIAHAHRAQQTEAHRSKREKLWVFFHFSSLSRFCPAVLCLCKVYGYALCACAIKLKLCGNTPRSVKSENRLVSESEMTWSNPNMFGRIAKTSSSYTGLWQKDRWLLFMSWTFVDWIPGSWISRI